MDMGKCLIMKVTVAWLDFGNQYSGQVRTEKFKMEFFKIAVKILKYQFRKFKISK